MNEVFFICKRFFEHKYYKIDEKTNCPESQYYKKIYIYCIINFMLNFILTFIPWKIKINTYDKIIRRLMPYTNRVSNIVNSTKNSSKIDKDINNSNSFKKEPTEIIIAYNNNNNDNNDNNINLNENNIESNIIITNTDRIIINKKVNLNQSISENLSNLSNLSNSFGINLQNNNSSRNKNNINKNKNNENKKIINKTNEDKISNKIIKFFKK